MYGSGYVRVWHQECSMVSIWAGCSSIIVLLVCLSYMSVSVCVMCEYVFFSIFRVYFLRFKSLLGLFFYFLALVIARLCVFDPFKMISYVFNVHIYSTAVYWRIYIYYNAVCKMTAHVCNAPLLKTAAAVLCWLDKKSHTHARSRARWNTNFVYSSILIPFASFSCCFLSFLFNSEDSLLPWRAIYCWRIVLLHSV